MSDQDHAAVSPGSSQPPPNPSRSNPSRSNPSRSAPSRPAWTAPRGPAAPHAAGSQPAADGSAHGPAGDAAPDDSFVASIRSGIADLDTKIGRADLPFDSVMSGLQWWYRPLIETRTWVALGSLFVGAVWGVIAFVMVALIFFTVFGLAFTVIGIVLVIPAFAAVNGMASIERARAGWVGEPIEAPQLAVAGPSVFSAIATRLTDGARWRQLLFFALFVAAGPLLFTLGTVVWGLVFQAVFNLDATPGIFTVPSLLIAAVLAGAAPRATIGVAWLGRAFTEALLGPNETVELQERVTELSGQRQQILDAVAGERRRIERNLHDGVQQQLVALGIDIGRAQSRVDSDPEGARELLDAARDKVRGSIGELRLIGRGLHPAVLEDRGLDAALSAVVAQSPIPISIEITTSQQLPENVASTAYYVASEAVTNILKHAHARVGSIRLDDDPHGGHSVRLTIHDDGRGGADSSRGSGLAGMRARVEGVDGVFHIDSRAGGPTTLVAVLPIAGAPSPTQPPPPRPADRSPT